MQARCSCSVAVFRVSRGVLGVRVLRWRWANTSIAAPEARRRRKSMPQQAWNAKRERQYEHIKNGLEERGNSEDLASEIAARTVNKERARAGESEQASETSIRDISSGRRGGLRSHKGSGGRTKEQLYEEARRKGVDGRSKMTKAELERAVDSLSLGVRRSITAPPGIVLTGGRGRCRTSASHPSRTEPGFSPEHRGFARVSGWPGRVGSGVHRSRSGRQAATGDSAVVVARILGPQDHRPPRPLRRRSARRRGPAEDPSPR